METIDHRQTKDALLFALLLAIINLACTHYLQASTKVILWSSAYFITPAVLLYFSPSEKNNPNWYDFAAFVWMALVLILKGKRFGGSVDLPYITYFAAAEGVYLWKYYRGMTGITFLKRPRLSDLLFTLSTLAVMWFALQWLALLIHFPKPVDAIAADSSLLNSLRITLQAITGHDFMAKWLRKILLTALIEEAGFRGLIQNLLAKTLGKTWLPIVIASALFGISHYGHGGWPYVGLSALAGLGFGKIYEKTESLSWSIGAHGLFDVLARALFIFP